MRWRFAPLRKWTLKEDRHLVKSWINARTNPFTKANQKKTGFWTKVAYAHNQHALNGAIKRTGKVFNARWNRAAPLIPKWCACVAQAYREKPSAVNDENIMQNTPKICMSV